MSRSPTPRIGLGPKYRLVREALTKGFRDYLDSRADWFDLLKNFRDALAHQIPLYIPPYTLNPARADEYQALDVAAQNALRSHDLESYERLQTDQAALTRFQPIMTHSLTMESSVVVFHYQILADFRIIDEMVGVLFDELGRSSGL